MSSTAIGIPDPCRPHRGDATQAIGEGRHRPLRHPPSPLDWLVAILLCLGLTAPALAEPEMVRMGLYLPIARDLNRSDARGALELWAEELTRRFQVPAEVRFYAHIDALRRDFDTRQVNLVIADAMSFVRHFQPGELADGFTTRLEEDASLLLLGRGDKSDLTLVGKRLARVDNDDISITYLETLCLKLHGRACADLPLQSVTVPNNHQALARLLFGQADYALVNRHGYRVATELNPQLGRQGQVLAELHFDTQYFGFFSARVSPRFRQHALSSLPRTHQEPRGRQMLDIFRVDRLVLADPGVLKPFYDLEREYQALRRQSGGRRE